MKVLNISINGSGISMCLNGKRNYCGGYKWSYSNPELLTKNTKKGVNKQWHK